MGSCIGQAIETSSICLFLRRKSGYWIACTIHMLCHVWKQVRYSKPVDGSYLVTWTAQAPHPPSPQANFVPCRMCWLTLQEGLAEGESASKTVWQAEALQSIKWPNRPSIEWRLSKSRTMSSLIHELGLKDGFPGQNRFSCQGGDVWRSSWIDIW